MKQLFLILAASVVAITGCNLTDTDTPTDTADQSESALKASAGNAGLPGRATVLRLLGTAQAYPDFVPDIDGDGAADPADCFDVDLLDHTGRKIGTATDCLSRIEFVGEGLALVGTTTFNLPNGSFTTRGSTTVQPVTTSGATPVTHTTGAVPMNGENGVIAGTGVYEQFRAQARLAGAVNLGKLESDGEISFDCLFSISPLQGEM